MPLKVASFFSGIGGFDLGFERVGMEIVFQCENNKFCQKVLKKHWPNALLLPDVKKVTVDQIPDVDLWCAGFPCQDVSSANQGKRKGFEGDRSSLFYAFAQLLKQKKQRPKWVVLENVSGLLNSTNGLDFKSLLTQMDELGYCVSWRVLDAKYFGVPQRRRRLFIVGSYRSRRSADVLFGERSPSIDPDQSRIARKNAAFRNGNGYQEPNLYVIQHASIGRNPKAGPQAKGYRNDGESWTLDSRGSADVICSTVNPFRIREAPGLSSRMDGSRYRSLGNAVPIPIVEWIGKRILLIDNTVDSSTNEELSGVIDSESRQLALALEI